MSEQSKNKILANSNLSRYNENVISLTLFGSYNTEFWHKEKSDIDILVFTKEPTIGKSRVFLFMNCLF